jgi:hypothetical protein
MQSSHSDASSWINAATWEAFQPCGWATRQRIAGKLFRQQQNGHYDTAQAAHPGALSSLMRLVTVSQEVFGTDYPFRTSIDHVRGLAAYFSGAALRAVERGNAVRLMPWLA